MTMVLFALPLNSSSAIISLIIPAHLSSKPTKSPINSPASSNRPTAKVSPVQSNNAVFVG